MVVYFIVDLEFEESLVKGEKREPIPAERFYAIIPEHKRIILRYDSREDPNITKDFLNLPDGVYINGLSKLDSERELEAWLEREAILEKDIKNMSTDDIVREILDFIL